VVVSDSVSGSLTLRLKNVPWDQALDIILKTKGLAMRQTGNVMLVAPSEEIAAREKLELESRKQIQELEPLYSEYMQVNYAKASDIADLLKSGETTLLSDRGMATIDSRTNTLLIQDTAAKLAEIRKLIARLDIPVRQVLIESRIVLANDDFSRDLGVRLGFTNSNTVDNGSTDITYGGRNPGGFIVDLPAASAAGTTSAFGVTVDKLGSFLVDLEINALEAEGKGEVVSSPRVLTSNQKAAYIETGTEIPYQQATSSGATSVTFKKAVLRLEATPQITPDDRIIMDLVINKDAVGEETAAGPAIDTNEISTQVLVDNGETLVLGGIYQEEQIRTIARTPILGEIPGIGWMFRNTSVDDDKSELLIFITPKIVKEDARI